MHTYNISYIIKNRHEGTCYDNIYGVEARVSGVQGQTYYRGSSKPDYSTKTLSQNNKQKM